jgi:hypothetical protein
MDDMDDMDDIARDYPGNGGYEEEMDYDEGCFEDAFHAIKTDDFELFRSSLKSCIESMLR